MLRVLLLGSVVAIAGCTEQPAATYSTASYCGSQGSEQAIQQCQSYYATHQVMPPHPVSYSRPAMDPGTRAALLGALIANQPRPIQSQFYAMPVYQPQYQNNSFSCIRSGNYVSCN